MPLKPCNTENMRKFVEALRSGKYRQGQKRLEKSSNGKTYNCCLGVACRVAMADGLNLTTNVGTSAMTDDTMTSFNLDTAFMPGAVADWLGLDCQAESDDLSDGCVNNPGILVNYGDEPKLIAATTLNDTHNSSFSVIADAFERTYLTD